jgi:hypothetical protein
LSDKWTGSRRQRLDPFGTHNSKGLKLCADVPPRGSITLDARDVHHLSNHLAVIIGFIELLIADASPSHPHYNDLLEIRTAAIAAANLIGKTPPGGDL